MTRRSILTFSLGPISGALISLIYLPTIAWFFPPEVVGQNNIYQTFLAFSLLIAVLGLDQAYVREYHEVKSSRLLLKTCFLPGLVLSLVAFFLSLPFASWLSWALYGEIEPRLYLLSAIAAVMMFVVRFMSLILRMQERGLSYSVSQIAPKLFLLTAVICYAVLGVTPTLYNLLAANVLALLFIVLLLLWQTWSEWRGVFKPTVDTVNVKRIFEFGLPLAVAGIAYWGLSATSVVALRFFSDFREIAIYSMAMSFAGVATVMQSIFSTVWMPTVYKWAKRSDSFERIDGVRRVITAAVCLLFCLVGALSWIVDFFLPQEYEWVKYIIVCCMAQPLLYTMSETTVVGLNIQRRSGVILVVSLVSFGCNALLSLVLVP
ncbi:MAG: lipopolysaccharide biosynthesis protein, partial [Candidatus Vecturithrix sp.]|nr:lipopolysaccharide biosynthesis protein [Candidatus Vecturithrix sp.]